MALSTRKKNSIIADIRVGRHDSLSKLCKHHKIDRKTAYKIMEKENIKYGQDSKIVEAGVELELLKKSTKNPHFENAINKAIKEKTEMELLREDLQLNNLKISKVLQEKIMQNKDNIDLTNIRSVSGTIKDIEAVANPRTQDIKVETNVQQNTIQNIAIEWE